jgi:hypothetical protein
VIAGCAWLVLVLDRLEAHVPGWVKAGVDGLVKPYSYGIFWIYFLTVFLGYRLTNDVLRWSDPQTFADLRGIFWTMTLTPLGFGWIFGVIVWWRKSRTA